MRTAQKQRENPAELLTIQPFSIFICEGTQNNSDRNLVYFLTEACSIFINNQMLAK